MAARPHLAKLSRAIEKLGGDHVIFDRIADGEPMRAIAETFGYSRGMIYTWIKAGGAERDQAWQAAKELRAHALVEDAGDELDKEAVTSAEASMLKARAEHKRWLAGVFNRKDYGDEKDQINVNLDIGQLHLDALRAHGRRLPDSAARVLPEAPAALPAGEA